MKKALLLFPLLLSGCSLFHNMAVRLQTDRFQYQCDEMILTVERHNDSELLTFIYQGASLGQPYTLKKGRSSSGEWYSDGVYSFWAHDDVAELYHHDWTILHHCTLMPR